MVAILVAAENATALPKLGKARMKDRVHASQTTTLFHKHPGRQRYSIHVPVRTGVLVRSSTLWKKLDPGSAPSRENAY